MGSFSNILILLSCLPMMGQAQSEYKDVRRMYDKPNEDIPVVSYQGYLNEVHPVLFYLGDKEGDVRGFYRMVSSGSIGFLEGERTGQNISLTETDEQGQQIGQFDFEGTEQMNGYWLALRRDEIIPITLTKSRYGDFIFKKQKEKIEHYSINLRKYTADVLIEEIDAERRVIHFQENEVFFPSVQTTCIEPCHDLTWNYEGRKINFVYKDNSLIKKELHREDYALQKDYEANISKFNYANTNFLTDFSYVETSAKGYNDWIKTLLRNTRTSKQAEVRSILSQSESSNEHFYFQWTGWQEVDYLNEEVISGRMVSHQSWNQQTKTNAIVYHLKENKAIDVMQEFRNIHSIDELIDELNTLHWTYRKEGFEDEQLDDIPFKVLILSNEGLIVSTEFNPLYGYKKIIIPYKVIKSSLKRNSIIHSAIKS